MALIPCGHRVIVETKDYDEHDEVMASARRAGLEIIKDSKTRYQASVDKGVIVAIGPTAWTDFGEPWAKLGDEVVFAKNSGRLVEDPEAKDRHFVAMNDEDIILVVRG